MAALPLLIFMGQRVLPTSELLLNYFYNFDAILRAVDIKVLTRVKSTLIFASTLPFYGFSAFQTIGPIEWVQNATVRSSIG